MPFPMKIQPVDHDPVGMKQPLSARWRFKRLFESRFPGVLKTTQLEKVIIPGDEKEKEKEGLGFGLELEPSSVCLGKMVQNFLEEGNERTSRCGRTRCNCFNGNNDDCSDDDADDSVCGEPQHEASEILKSLVMCVSAVEKNLLADVVKIVEICRGKGGGEVDRHALVQGLVKIGYDAAVCKSKWTKTSTFPAGVYEYVDVNMDGGERLLVDVDFKSEFEILRSTKNYSSVLQTLPVIFVGKTDRLQQIVAVVCEAAKQSMKRKGLHIPPWRRSEYMRSKWDSPFERLPPPSPAKEEAGEENKGGGGGGGKVARGGDSSSDDSLSLEKSSDEKLPDEMLDQRLEKKSGELEVWQLPAVEPKAATPRGGKMVSGLLV